MADKKVYLQKQKVRPSRGIPGYKGKNIVVVDDPAAAKAADAAKAAKAAETAESKAAKSTGSAGKGS